MTVRVGPRQRPERAMTSRPRITGAAMLPPWVSQAARPVRGASAESASWLRWLLPWRRRSRRRSLRSASLARRPLARPPLARPPLD
jgi:hypothetical protein